MAWGGWSSLAAVQGSMHLGIDALATLWPAAWQRWKTRKIGLRLPAMFLGPGLLWSACFGADHGGRRASKMVAAIGRGSSNLVNAAGS